MNVGVVLKKFRESRGLTILELGAKSKTGNGTIGDIERGATTPRQKTLEKIAEALNLTKKEREELFLSILSDKIPKYSKIELLVKGHVIGNDDQIEAKNYIYEGKTLEDDVHKECFFIKLDSENSQMPRGGVLLIDPLQVDIENLKIYLIEMEGRQYLKRIRKIKDGSFLILKSLNDNTDDIDVKIDEIKILGRAVKFNYEVDL